MKTLVNVLLVCLLLAGAASAADLYRIKVNSAADAERFNSLRLQPIATLADGYLVLAEPDAVVQLSGETRARLVAHDVDASDLALDLRKDRLNGSRFPLLFEEDAVRLYRVPASLIREPGGQLGLRQVSILPQKIQYAVSRKIDVSELRSGISLESLIGMVSQDSLTAWTTRLQAYNGRVTNTDSAFAAQQWTKDKFLSFGYDSVYLDTFNASTPEDPYIVRNVVAVKEGSRFPKRYIVIGGHLDGVDYSPAADDNGSGAVGTLEIARVLAQIESYATLIFVAFDGEEEGLYGSDHFADAAAARGDTILFMLDMDMIAYYENTDQAKLYSGLDQTYVVLWQQLADSLLGITGTFAGASTSSDHYSFVENGYASLFVHEKTFSTVYHSNRDSTTYVNFDYMTKMVKATLATAYAGMLNETQPGFGFVYRPSIPLFLRAGSTTTAYVTLKSRNDASPVSGSGRLNYSINSGAHQQVPLTEVLPANFEFVLPGLDCDDTLRFFISIEETTVGLLSDGSATNPHICETVTSKWTPFADDFETDQGWTTEVIGASDGAWERGVPINDLSWHYTPATDGDGSGSCYLTDNASGNSDVDSGAVRLTSPVFDLTPAGYIFYDYFLTVNSPAGAVDRLVVEVNDGLDTAWRQVALHTTDTELRWAMASITAEQIVAAGTALSSAMRVRFTVNDATPGSVIEAGIDGFRTVAYHCIQDSAYACGDANGDAVVDISDAVYLIAYIFSGGPAPNPLLAGDASCDGEVDISDTVYLIAYIFSGGAEPCAECK